MRYKTGDGRKFRTMQEAIDHASLVARVSGVIISVEELCR